MLRRETNAAEENLAARDLLYHRRGHGHGARLQGGQPSGIVPVPRSITADCGLAWRCEPTLRGPVEALADPEEVMGIYELEI